MSDPYLYYSTYHKMYRNQAGRLQLRISNHVYRFDKEDKGRGKQRIFVWKCQEANCPVKIRTDDEGNNEIFVKGAVHNHDGTMGH